MMHWEESLRFALWALRIDKVKAFLTMLGVIIGTTSIVLVVTIVSTGKAYIQAQIEGIGANLAYAVLERDATTVVEDELTPGDLAAVQQALLSVAVAAGTYDVPVEIPTRGKVHPARLVGVTEHFQTIRNLRTTSGRYFDSEDFQSRSKVCLVTDRVAEEVFGADSAVGNTIRLDQFRCSIVGTFKEGVPTFGRSEIQDETVLVPFPLIRMITGADFFQVLYVQAHSSQEVALMTEQMHDLLRSRHRKEAHYSVENLSSLLKTANQVSLAMSAVLLGVAFLMLTTAGTGIMNIMLVNISQRTREIGLRKALGAKRSEIQMQFLMEAVFISIGGALLGIVTALVLVWSAARFVEAGVPVSVSWAAIPVALIVPTAVGILFGYRPAAQAARLNPIDALRSD